MPEGIEERLAGLAQRAGLRGVSPKVVGAALCVLAVAVAWAAWRWWPQGDNALELGDGVTVSSAALPTGNEGPVVSGRSQDATDVPDARVWVHVVGAVRHPGLYDLESGARVEAAVEAAGGLLGNAAPEAVNLARIVADGEQIAIPTADEAERGGGVVAGAAALGGGAPAGKVNLNIATVEQLDALPGIGPSTATKIVADREANGPYASPDDLGRVSGIGPKKLEGLKDLVSVN